MHTCIQKDDIIIIIVNRGYGKYWLLQVGQSQLSIYNQSITITSQSTEDAMRYRWLKRTTGLLKIQMIILNCSHSW